VTGDQFEVGVDEKRDIKAEARNTFGGLLDLLLTVKSRVLWIRFELVDRNVRDCERLLR
jgi:hypothetical protein